MTINETAAGDAVTQRAHALLALGAGAADALGRQADNDTGKALRLLEQVGARSTSLLNVNLRLVPLMTELQRDGVKLKNKWWRRFTGAQLEYDVRFENMRNEIETLAESGRKGQQESRQSVAAMRALTKVMAIELRLLEAEIEAAQLVGSPAFAARREAAGLVGEALARFSRRASNLSAMATATQLTRAQFEVAIKHAESVSDRYHEIQTLLLPIWRQSVGFDLFSRHTHAKES